MIIDLNKVAKAAFTIFVDLFCAMFDGVVSLIPGLVVGVFLGILLCAAATEDYRLNHRTVFITQKCPEMPSADCGRNEFGLWECRAAP